MASLNLKVLSSSEIIWKGNAEKVILPTETGEITVLNNHSPLISNIGIGELKIVTENNLELTYLVQGGVLDVKESSYSGTSEVIVLVDRKFADEEIETLDEEIKRAKEVMEMKKEDYDFAEEEANIERALYLKRKK